MKGILKGLAVAAPIATAPFGGWVATIGTLGAAGAAAATRRRAGPPAAPEPAPAAPTPPTLPWWPYLVGAGLQTIGGLAGARAQAQAAREAAALAQMGQREALEYLRAAEERRLQEAREQQQYERALTERQREALLPFWEAGVQATRAVQRALGD